MPTTQTQRLPIPGSDDGTWGNVLNGYLGVEHNGDGTLKIRTDGTVPILSSGQVSTSNLGSGTASNNTYLRGDGTWSTVSAAGNVSIRAAAVTVTTPSGTAHITGDINGDGRVNALDVSILIDHDNQNYIPAELSHDSTVGAADLAILLSKWTW
jgi:hypothetical protein